ncbi:tRNA-queuosine alpha-mannosyltransferase domain-containing protein [Marinimicrobium alkaliphilum]|uniref:tRNA-queuosine alpha-mannosyltransferase domain-containing protein n=1 Tax=Marinimicrobium alkaliphilum TaxID=2202654 RepID=UPI000DBA0848|nr:DUF3524 domain-containing protein [Marinimicrobium alkaliphilum]
MRVLLLSAYDADSHRRWRLDLARHLDDWHWTQLALPPRHFRWRVRGNSLSWSQENAQTLNAGYDLIIATSMTDLSALRGLVPALASIPTVLYFHENQFAYPVRQTQLSPVEPQVISLYSALCADRVLFNSPYNSQSFFEGCEALLNRLPDQVPEGVVDQIKAKSAVIPVPLADHCFTDKTSSETCFSLVWNHRWEYDKGPERLLSLLRTYFARPNAPALNVHVVGQQFRQQPPAFAAVAELLEQHRALGRWGYVEGAGEYRQLLARSHGVLSTAVHDFQGLSVLEAVAAGCIPLVPARLAYPDWFAEPWCYASHLEHPEREAEAAAEQLYRRACQWYSGTLPSEPSVAALSWEALEPEYRRCLSAVAQVQ